jgi:hypothetical protein
VKAASGTIGASARFFLRQRRAGSAGRCAQPQQHPVLEGDVLAAGLVQLFGQLVEPLFRRFGLSQGGRPP